MRVRPLFEILRAASALLYVVVKGIHWIVLDDGLMDELFRVLVLEELHDLVCLVDGPAVGNSHFQRLLRLVFRFDRQVVEDSFWSAFETDNTLFKSTQNCAQPSGDDFLLTPNPLLPFHFRLLQLLLGKPLLLGALLLLQPQVPVRLYLLLALLIFLDCLFSQVRLDKLNLLT